MATADHFNHFPQEQSGDVSLNSLGPALDFSVGEEQITGLGGRGLLCVAALQWSGSMGDGD